VKLRHRKTWVDPWGKRHKLDGRLDDGLLNRLAALRTMRSALVDVVEEVKSLPKPYWNGSERCAIIGALQGVERYVKWCEHCIEIGGKR